MTVHTWWLYAGELGIDQISAWVAVEHPDSASPTSGYTNQTMPGLDGVTRIDQHRPSNYIASTPM